MSRKLLFASGMMVVFSCQLADIETSDQLARHLMIRMQQTPLEVLATVLPKIELQTEARMLFDCYDEYITNMNDPKVRGNLVRLTDENAYEDPTFLKLRELSHRFQKVLTDVFFEQPSALRDFNKQYGVF